MVHTRSRSPSTSREPTAKRLKTTHAPSDAVHEDWAASRFHPTLLEPENVKQLHGAYVTSTPYKYAVVDKLFQHDLLERVKDECLGELSFTEKETDIYKVHQTGDLASLSYLDENQIALLPSLLTLRNALYSPTFRAFVRSVTGCGPLSGTKQDMSLNTYKKGCHLLNHDDVIGSRRVSYILYMPLPSFQMWQPDWGGALELYDTVLGPDGVPEPVPTPCKAIPPSWNQFVFFEVQPGKSFHSVEEVIVGEGEDGRQRLSISGWFHAAQHGEDGYEPDAISEAKSSREQLTSTITALRPYPETTDPPLPGTPLSPEHISFLSEFLNPVYLRPRTMQALATRFVEESSLELHSFLCEPLAAKLEHALHETDARDGLGAQRPTRIPPHTAGIVPFTPPDASPSDEDMPAANNAWTIRGPPHKWRYCALQPSSSAEIVPSGPAEDGSATNAAATAARPRSPAVAVSPRAALESADELLRSLQDELFPSEAYRAWLAGVTRLLPTQHTAAARRFRPGLDYTLATSEAGEARLDAVLGLTPEVVVRVHDAPKGPSGRGRRRVREVNGWTTGEWGGWECYMAPHDEEDDPAVYRSGGHNNGRSKDAEGAVAGPSNGTNGHGKAEAARHPSPDSKPATTNNGANRGSISPTRGSPSGKTSPGVSDGQRSDAGMTEDEDDGEEEDGTLLTVQPGFNRLLLVLRDEGVMRFVKYVSAAAEGSRWDVCGEYEVGIVEEESD